MTQNTYDNILSRLQGYDIVGLYELGLPRNFSANTGLSTSDFIRFYNVYSGNEKIEEPKKYEYKTTGFESIQDYLDYVRANNITFTPVNLNAATANIAADDIRY